MRVSLFTTTYNNENLIKDFVKFYKDKVPTITIFIFDKKSTDKTKEIAEKEGCVVRDFYDFYISKDIWKNNCWKHTPCDCVVLCNINEFIDITLDCFNNCSIIQCEGYDIVDLNNLDRKKRNSDFDKFCMFDPGVIREINYDKDSCNPVGFVRIGEKKPILYHLTKLK